MPGSEQISTGLDGGAVAEWPKALLYIEKTKKAGGIAKHAPQVNGVRLVSPSISSRM